MANTPDINKATVHRKPNRLLTIVLAFFLGGAAHVFLYGVDIADSICQILYGASLLLWGNNINSRITDNRIRRLLLTTVGLLAVNFLLQVCRFRLIPDEQIILLRYAWYLYYISLVVVPLLVFFIAIILNRRENEKIRPGFFLLFIPAVLLIAVFLTNDCHNLAFRLAKDSHGQSGSYSYGPFFFAYIVWSITLCCSAIIIILKKSSHYVFKKNVVIPILFFVFGIVLQILTVFDLPRLYGVTVWRIVEVYAFCIISFMEACIQTGIISSNTSYTSLFAVADKKIRLSDKSGHTLYASAEGAKAFEKNEDNQINVKEISGGSVSWVVDISALNKLNREISKATEQIETRNEYLKTDISIKEERSVIDTRNRLYDNIAGIIKPQIDAVGNLLKKADDENFDKLISKAAILEAYIKRRSNMELLKASSGRLPVQELQTAVSESCEYIRLYGVNTAVNTVTDGDFPIDVIIPEYEAFENIIEKALPVMNALLVNIFVSDTSFSMRIYLGTEPVQPQDNDASADILRELTDVKNRIALAGGKLKYDTEDGLIITVSFEKGGETL